MNKIKGLKNNGESKSFSSRNRGDSRLLPRCKVLDALLLTQAAHQQTSVLLRYDVALQTLQHHLSVLRRMHTQFRQLYISTGRQPWHCPLHPAAARCAANPSYPGHSIRTPPYQSPAHPKAPPRCSPAETPFGSSSMHTRYTRRILLPGSARIC